MNVKTVVTIAHIKNSVKTWMGVTNVVAQKGTMVMEWEMKVVPLKTKEAIDHF